MLQIESNKDVTDYYEQITNCNFLPLITLPTRITSRSKTLIDNILTNNFDHEIKSGNLTVNISDHMPQFAIIPLLKKNSLPKDHNVYVRDTRNLDINKLKKEINDLNFEYTKTGSCINDDTKRFISETNKIIDKHVPLRKLTNKEIKNKTKPWITNETRSLIKKRNKLFNNLKNEALLTKKEELKLKIKVLKNKIKHLLRDSKSKYFKNYFEDNANNIRNLWKGINEIISNQKNRRADINCIETEDKKSRETITNKTEIANKFNKFFSNVAGKLLKKKKIRG